MAKEEGGQVEIVSASPAPPESEGPLSDAIEKARSELGSAPTPPPPAAVGDEQPEPEGDEGDEGKEAAAPGEEALEEPEAAPAEGDEEEAGEGEEAEVEGEGDDESVVLELPEALREQGVDEIEVPKEDEKLMRALINSYESRKEREAGEQELQTLSADLEQRWARSRAVMAAAPFYFAREHLGVEPDVLMDEIKVQLLSEPQALEQIMEWAERVGGDERELDIERRRLQQDRNTRFERVQREQQEHVKLERHAQKLNQELQRLAASVPEEVRDRVVQAAGLELMQEAKRRADAGKDELIQPGELKGIIGWLIEPYAGRAATNGDEKPLAEQAQEAPKKIQKKLDRRKAGTGARSATGTLARGGPAKGMQLDDVLKHLKDTTGIGGG